MSPPAPPPVETWSPESYEYEDYAREISMSVFDAENQIRVQTFRLNLLNCSNFNYVIVHLNMDLYNFSIIFVFMFANYSRSC